jgi:hypothetical protein
MTKGENEPTTEQLLSEFGAIFGPPVLSTEPIEQYQKLFTQVAKSRGAPDIIELILAKRIADGVWLSGRYARHGTVLIERRCRESLEFQARQSKERKERRQAAIREFAEKTGRPQSDFVKLNELDDIAELAPEEFDRILEQTPTELDHNRALEATMELQERFDRLTNSADKRVDDGLKVREQYRASQRARHAADETVDAEYEEVQSPREQIAAPMLAPSDEDGDDIPAQDHVKS